MSSYVSAALRRLVAERAAYLCEYCLLHEEDTLLWLLGAASGARTREVSQCRCHRTPDGAHLTHRRT